MKTITLSDAAAAELLSALNAAGSQQPGPQPQPPEPPVPSVPGVKVVDISWASTAGRAVARIPASGSLAFRFTVPAGYRGGPCSFSQSPSGGADYYFRNTMLSDKPGEFAEGPFDPLAVKAMSAKANQDSRQVFMVGVPFLRGVLVKRPDLSIPILESGKTYYFNVRQVDPTLSCQIDYALNVAA